MMSCTLRWDCTCADGGQPSCAPPATHSCFPTVVPVGTLRHDTVKLVCFSPFKLRRCVWLSRQRLTTASDSDLAVNLGLRVTSKGEPREGKRTDSETDEVLAKRPQALVPVLEKRRASVFLCCCCAHTRIGNDTMHCTMQPIVHIIPPRSPRD
jgi:hypothetical protein